MTDELKQRIIDYIGKCRICTVATVGPDNKPSVSTVFFKNKGLDLYFNTGRDSGKVSNIQTNPNVAVAMQTEQSETLDDKSIKGIQYYGSARVLNDNEMSDVPEAVTARHRAFNSVRAGNSVVVVIKPQRVYMIDYAQGFRHRDRLEVV